ncbi:TPA: hypothetical protein DIV49_00985 [Candidatus Saccharibacteria bacterium]|nr:hypothetical protein [Candidatus Saccharibacteria bacterium]HRJ91043.1 hypothetical protein [Candidatus Saccharibacteria bacterium]
MKLPLRKPKFGLFVVLMALMALLLGGTPNASAMESDDFQVGSSSQSDNCDDVLASDNTIVSVASFVMNRATASDSGTFNNCIKPVQTDPLPPTRTPADCVQGGSLTVPVQTDPNVKGVKVDGKRRALPYTTNTPGNHVVDYLYTKVARVAHDPSGPYPVEAQLACGGKVVPPCGKGSAKVVTNCKALHNAARVVVKSDVKSNTMVTCKVTFRRNGEQVREPFTNCSVEPGKSFTKTFKHLKRGTKVTVRVAGKAWSAIVKAKCSPSTPPDTGQKTVGKA